MTQIRLLQRYLSDGYNYDRDYLRGSEIYVDDQLCTTIPDDGENNGQWFELTCDEPLSGSKITINQMREGRSIVICGVEVKTNADPVTLTGTDAWIALGAIVAFFGFFALIIIIVLVVAL